MHAVVLALAIVSGILVSTLQRDEKNVIILTPDPDGRVGQVEVVTRGGQQILDAANQMTVVGHPDKPPSAVTVATTEDIDRNFSEALSFLPLPPVKFLLYFQPDGTELEASSAQILPKILAAIILREAKDIGIHGHSDRVGTAESNFDLSLRRAMAIESILLQNGISRDFLEVASHGEGNPLVPTPDEVAEPRNRRVEVIVR